jgi:hypothetical protein
MTTLTMRYIKGDFVVTGPDIEPTRFKTRREAKDWCVAHYPGSPIKEIGPIQASPAERRAVKREPAGKHTPACRHEAEEDWGQ